MLSGLPGGGEGMESTLAHSGRTVTQGQKKSRESAPLIVLTPTASSNQYSEARSRPLPFARDVTAVVGMCPLEDASGPGLGHLGR